MCGIAGYITNQGIIRPDLMEAMVTTLLHRGPDDSGILVHDTPSIQIALAHTRLKVIDLSNAGHQPMQSDNGLFAITYNGEVYNYASLRNQLERLGHNFRSRSDTEVVLNSYIEWGPEAFNKFDGMFAFCIADFTKNETILCRDPFGIKPLYYYANSHRIGFASEIKALLCDKSCNSRLSKLGLNEMLMFRSMSAERTMFEGIHLLSPGHYLRISDQLRITRHEYAQVYASRDKTKSFSNFADAQDTLEQLIHKSVTNRLIADVPIGIQLSGGVDSSLITAVAAANQQVETFSIDFNEEKFSERPYIDAVANQYATRKHIFTLSNHDFPAYLQKLIWHMDEPLLHPHLIPLFILCRQARDQVTILLSGEGADELFSGYYWYKKPHISKLIKNVPGHQTLTQILSAISPARFSFASEASSQDINWIMVNAHNFLGYERLKQIVNPELIASYDEITTHRSDVIRPEDSALRNLQRIDQTTYLQALLLRQDKMSMASGLEVRVPFLERNIVEYAQQIPDNHKINKFRDKYILKKIAERYIPNRNIYRKKVGFQVPIDDWFRNDSGMGDLLSILLDRTTIQRGLFSQPALEKIILEHRKGTGNYAEAILWPLLNLELWHRIFIDTPGLKDSWT